MSTSSKVATEVVTELLSSRAMRNAGMPLNLDHINNARVNLSAVERRAATLTTRRSVKKEWQAAWLIKALTCIDLTTLSGDDTPDRVARLCAKARMPLRTDLVEALGLEEMPQVGVSAFIRRW